MAKHVLINKQTAAASATQVLANVANPSLLTDGQLAFYNANTNAAFIDTATPGVIPFYVAMGVPSGRNARISPIIKAGAVKNIEFKSFTPTVQPILTAGYQGTGALTLNFLAASGSTTVPYGIKIENLVTNVPPFPKAYAQYTLTASKGAANQNPLYVADQLVKDLNSQLSIMPVIDGGQFAIVDVLSDLTLATAAASGTSVTYAVTNGSPTLVITDTVALTNGTALVAGCWIRIGANGTAGLNPVYQIANVVVTSSTVTTVTLTRPFVGTTAASAAIAGLKVASATSVLPTSSTLVGIKVAVIGNYFTANNYAASKPNTNVNIPLLDTLAGTPITVSQALVYGSGSANYVLNQEMQVLGNLGVENRIWLPLSNDTYATTNIGTGAEASTPSNGFTVITLNYDNSVSDKSAQGQGRLEPGSLDICINNYQTGTTAQTMTNLVAMIASLTGLPSGTVAGSFPSVTYPNW
jgi:hypothetical protein